MSNDVQVRRDDGFVVTAPMISLREWYAGMVIQGISASCACLRTPGEVATFSTRMAAIAFAIADAMLAEAAKAEPPQ